MTCKDSWKEMGLFSLEEAGDRREEQSDAPQRAVPVGSQLCSSRNHMAESWSNAGMQEGTAHRKESVLSLETLKSIFINGSKPSLQESFLK